MVLSEKLRELEDPFEKPPAEQLNIADPALDEVYREHWREIRTRYLLSKSGRNDTYCFRLRTGLREEMKQCLLLVFEQTPVSFKLNISFSLILQNVETGAFRFFYASRNFYLFQESFLITNKRSFQKMLKAFEKAQIIQTYTQSLRKDSKWVFRSLVSLDVYVVRTSYPR